TDFAKPGTIRYVETNPIYPAPDPRIIHDYVEGSLGTAFRYALFNIDSLRIILGPANSSVSDTVAVFDHVYGSKDPNAVICVNGFDKNNGVFCPKSTATGGPVTLANPVDVSIE